MIKLALTTFFVIICCSISYGQSIASISGKVINADGRGLFGNAIILSPQDSSIVQGAPFFEGEFELLGLDQQNILLKLTSLEFRDTFLVVEYEGVAQVHLGNIVVKEAQQELGEVVVVGKKPLVREKADGSLEVKVANTTLATSTSVNEILSKSPGVVMDESNAVNVFGKGEAIIFINEIRVANDRLSTLSPSDIERIDIISNPGARYDAEGNAVINIITKRNVGEGSKGMVKNYLSYADFGGLQNRADVNYSYSRGKWALNSNYAFLTGKDRHILETTRTRNTDEDYFNSHLKTDRHYELNSESSYGVGGQYNFNANNYLSLQYSGAYEDLGGEQLSRNMITYEEVGIYESTLQYDNQALKNNVSANYYRQADSLGSNLFVGIQYASYQYDLDNDIDQISTVDKKQTTELINNIGANNTGILSAQADYTKVFARERLLEFGLKFSRATIKSNTSFFDITQDGHKITNNELSNNFDYDERVPAAYASFKGSMSGKLNYSLGLRSEYTHYILNTSVDEGRKIEDHYLNLFPNASVSTQLSDGANLYLTYSSRINRAPYDRLNPFVVYQDAFTSIQGNPDLRPSIVHSMELGGGYKGWGLKTSYSYTKDPIDGGAFQSKTDPRVYILQRANLSRGRLYNATLSKNINLFWWQSINTASMSYSNLIDDAQRFEVGENHPYFYLYSQNNFDVRDWFTLYVTAWYLSNKQDGINNEKDLSSINIGLEKKILQDRLTLNLDFNDIFHEVRYDGEYTLGLTDIIYANTMNTNYIRLSLTYNFGKLKQLNYKNKNVGESETKRAQ